MDLGWFGDQCQVVIVVVIEMCWWVVVYDVLQQYVMGELQVLVVEEVFVGYYFVVWYFVEVGGDVFDFFNFSQLFGE